MPRSKKLNRAEKKAARKLFREENPVGESFKVGVEGPYKVTGVLKDTGHKSHIAFDALASMATVRSLAASKRNKDFDSHLSDKDLDNWYEYTSGWVYVLMEKGKTFKRWSATCETVSGFALPSQYQYLSMLPWEIFLSHRHHLLA